MGYRPREHRLCRIFNTSEPVYKVEAVLQLP